jgi:hypothetical protein
MADLGGSNLGSPNPVLQTRCRLRIRQQQALLLDPDDRVLPCAL